MSKRMLVSIAALLPLCLTLAGCGDSGSSLIGKWQDIAGSGIASYGQVIEFVDKSNLNLGQSAVTYSAIDGTHLKLTSPTVSEIVGMALASDRLTLSLNGQTSTFARVSGTTLPLDTMPSPVTGTWQLAPSSDGSSGSLDIEGTSIEPGDIVQFTGTAVRGTMLYRAASGNSNGGTARLPYTVNGPTQITFGFLGTFDVASKTHDTLKLTYENALLGGVTYAFTRAGKSAT